jgi:Protein of unknown function (DUF3102)
MELPMSNKQTTKASTVMKAISEPKIVSEPKSRSEFADQIHANYKATIDGILKMGSTLNTAKKALVHGQFQEMIEHDLPFTASTAERLMKIANDSRITNPAHVQLLPFAWGTLYELSKLPNAAFEQALSSGAINPRMTRGNAVKLLAAPASAPANQVTAPANKVQKALEHLYTLACDAKADWMNVDLDMTRDLIEELNSRLNSRTEAARREKEWTN